MIIDEDLTVKAVKKLPKVYIRSGSMYLFKTNNIEKHASILGKKTYGLEVSGKYALNIDEKEDLVLTRHFFGKH